MTIATRPLDKITASLAFALGLATILAALGSQYIGGLFPCDLCLQQRMAYYYGLPLLAAILVLWNRLPLTAWYIAMAVVTAIFLWGAYMGAYHAGVEWGYWPGPAACSGMGTTFSLDDMLNAKPVVACDVVQFRFLGLSLAGYNAIISLAVAALLAASIFFQFRRSRG